MSDDEAVSALQSLPHEIAERSASGISFNCVVDAHEITRVDASSSSSSGGDNADAKKHLVKTSVQPRENQIKSSSEYQSIEYTKDGSMFASVASDGNSVVVFDSETNTEISRIDEDMSGTSCVSFSNTGKFLSIYRKGANHAGGTKEKNLSVWEIKSGEERPKKVFECFQKTFVKQEWPYLQFTKDDRVCARCVTNEIQFYDAENFDETNFVRYRIPGVALARLSMSETKPTVGVFVPESKGIPGSVRIYEVPDVKKATSGGGENASSPSPPASLQHVTGSPWPTHRPIWRSHSNPTPCSGVPLARGGRPNIARS